MGLRTLNTHAPWVSVLELLGVPVKGQALPARLTCPLCHTGRLHVYEDTTSGGAWHYCHQCLSAGDMIELCAAAWDCSPAVAVRRLVNKGIPIPAERTTAEEIQQYVLSQPMTRNRMRDFWRQSRERLTHSRSATVAQLLGRFQLSLTSDVDRWERTAGRHLGVTRREDVEKTFNAGSWRARSSHCYTLRGGGWQDVLVLAFHDLPERIAGFLLAGRGGRAEDRVFRTTGPRFLYPGRDPFEAGLAGLDTLDASKSMFGEHVLAVDDALLAARLQLRHYQTNDRPLPLVAYHDSERIRTRNVWKVLDRHLPVFFGWQLTPTLLHQAIIADGLIALAPLDRVCKESIDHYLRLDEPRDLFRKALKRAKPWRQMLRDWAEETTDAAIENLLLGLEGYGHDPRVLAAVTDRLADLVLAPKTVTEAHLGNRTIVEKDGQWWSVYSGDTHHQRRSLGPRQDTIIMNAILRVEEEFCKGEALYYRGHLLFEGQEMPWEYAATTLEKATTTTLTSLVLRHCGRHLYIAPGWKTRLVTVATLFQTPRPAENV